MEGRRVFTWSLTLEARQPTILRTHQMRPLSGCTAVTILRVTFSLSREIPRYIRSLLSHIYPVTPPRVIVNELSPRSGMLQVEKVRNRSFPARTPQSHARLPKAWRCHNFGFHRNHLVASSHNSASQLPSLVKFAASYDALTALLSAGNCSNRFTRVMVGAEQPLVKIALGPERGWAGQPASNCPAAGPSLRNHSQTRHWRAEERQKRHRQNCTFFPIPLQSCCLVTEFQNG